MFLSATCQSFDSYRGEKGETLPADNCLKKRFSEQRRTTSYIEKLTLDQSILVRI